MNNSCSNFAFFQRCHLFLTRRLSIGPLWKLSENCGGGSFWEVPRDICECVVLTTRFCSHPFPLSKEIFFFRDSTHLKTKLQISAPFAGWIELDGFLTMRRNLCMIHKTGSQRVPNSKLVTPKWLVMYTLFHELRTALGNLERTSANQESGRNGVSQSGQQGRRQSRSSGAPAPTSSALMKQTTRFRATFFRALPAPLHTSQHAALHGVRET